MFAKTKTKFEILTITLILVSGVFVFSASDAKAAAGIFKQINFQGKVVNKTPGTNVADNTYTFTFSIYDAASGGTLLWDETKDLTVTDGIFQTNLGDTDTTLGTSVNFNTDSIYLGINFAGDGEMTTRVRFTAAPYAFNADNANALAGGTWAAPGAIGGTTAAAGTFTNLTTNTGGISIAAGQSYTGAGAVTLSSTTNGLTLNSGNNTLTIDSSDTALSAAGVTTLTLGANTTITNASGNISLQAASTGTANIQIGDGGTTSATPDLLVLDIGSAEPTGTNGAMYYSTALNKFRCFQNAAWADCIGVGGSGPWTDGSGITYLTDAAEDFAVGGSTLSSIFSVDVSAAQMRLSYDASNYATFTTANDGKLSMQTTGSTQSMIKVGSGAAQDSGVSFDGNVNDYYVGMDDTTDKFMIGLGQTVGTTPSLTIDSTGLISIAGDLAVQGGEINLTGIASSASTTEGTIYYDNDDDNLYVYANGGWVDLTVQGGGSQTPWAQDISAAGFDLGGLSNLGFGETTGAPLGTEVGFFRDNTGDLTGNVLTGKTLNLAVNGTDEYNFSATGLAFNSNNITGFGANLTAAGATTFASGAGGALTINSDTTGNINIGDDASNETINFGTGAGIKTLNIGSLNSSSVTNIQSGTAGIKLQVAGTSVVGTVQIGNGSGLTETPDFLSLDSKLSNGDPAGGTGGDMYYNMQGAKFRCFEGAGWKDCDTGGAGGSPGGSDKQIQFNDGGSTFAGDADFTWDKTNNDLTLPGVDTGITMAGITNEPSPAPANNLSLYAKSIAGRMFPKWVGPSGVDNPMQSALFQNAIYTWTPTTATAGLWYGTAGRTPAGTFSNLLPTPTNFYTMMKRGNWINVVTTTNQMVGPGTSEALFQRGGSAQQGGFFYVARFGLSAFTTGSRMFVGLSSSATTLTGNPSAVVNMAGFALDAGETALTFMHNDGSGTATKDVITGLPALAANQGFDAYIYAKPNDTTIYWRLDNSSTGVTIASGSTSTDLPVATTNMYAQAVAGNAALTTVGSVGIGVNRIYVETDK